jgi:hypothetical protein
MCEKNHNFHKYGLIFKTRSDIYPHDEAMFKAFRKNFGLFGDHFLVIFAHKKKAYCFRICTPIYYETRIYIFHVSAKKIISWIYLGY